MRRTLEDVDSSLSAFIDADAEFSPEINGTCRRRADGKSVRGGWHHSRESARFEGDCVVRFHMKQSRSLNDDRSA